MHKLFEKKLLHKLDHWLSINEVISPMQFAFQKGCSSKDSVLALNEKIHFYNERGNNVYVMFSDVAKSCDSVWQDGLFYKLHEIGLKGKFWKILKGSYANFKCTVLINCTCSETFRIEKGVHQGAPISMRLYQIYDNDLLESLRNNQESLGIFDIKSGNPAFADDIAVAALFVKTMNNMLCEVE